MAQFDIRQNSDSRSRDRYPYLIELQSDVLADLPTRVVAPLRSRSLLPPIGRLNPVVSVLTNEFVVVAQELASVPFASLGPIVGHAVSERVALTAAVDLMFTGF